MSVAVEIELVEIRNGFRRAAGRHFARPDEAPEALNHLDVEEMWHMELVVAAKETVLDANSQRRLQQKFQHS